ncbi:hypothetical protein CEXT_568991 [Caerostris extrusa]|uniref:Uncharacterized protein n=1 Tax=Caerostris extrusa TaxID=172846 RepID=A0AAV4Y7E6_CAEEX|nr:hypothetical protein CEXT_568991 [Caerostris extrusa]
MVRFNDGLKEQVAASSNQHKEDVRVKLAGEQLKIFPVNSDVHRAVTRYLTEKKLEFFVITPKNQRPLKAVLKGLPVSYSTAEIEGLSELGLKLDQVRQLSNLKTKAPITVWQLTNRKAPENVNIFQAVAISSAFSGVEVINVLLLSVSGGILVGVYRTAATFFQRAVLSSFKFSVSVAHL